MPLYLVKWEIEVEANDKEEASREAECMIRHPGDLETAPRVFEVAEIRDVGETGDIEEGPYKEFDLCEWATCVCGRPAIETPSDGLLIPATAAHRLFETIDPDHPTGAPSWPCTLARLVDQNQDGFGVDDVAALVALPVGGVYSIGGGAAGRYDIKRLPDEPVPRGCTQCGDQGCPACA
jgi:hypothetical protein